MSELDPSLQIQDERMTAYQQGFAEAMQQAAEKLRELIEVINREEGERPPEITDQYKQYERIGVRRALAAIEEIK